MLTSLVYLQHRNVKKKIRKMIKIEIVNTGKEKLHIFWTTWENWRFQERCAYIDLGGDEFPISSTKVYTRISLHLSIMYGWKLISIFCKWFKIVLESDHRDTRSIVMSKIVIFIYDAIKVGWTIYSSLELQSYTKYLKETVVFMWDSAIWEKFNFCFSGVFC